MSERGQSRRMMNRDFVSVFHVSVMALPWVFTSPLSQLPSRSDDNIGRTFQGHHTLVLTVSWFEVYSGTVTAQMA